MAQHTDEQKHHHIVSVRMNLIIFGVLLVLLILTVAVAQVDFGPLNVVIALTIAIVKAVLIMLYFMHVRFSSRLTWVFAGAAFLWLAILLTTVGDYITRAWLTGPGAL